MSLFSGSKKYIAPLCCVTYIGLFSVEAFAAGCVASRGAGMSYNALGIQKLDTSMLEGGADSHEHTEMDKDSGVQVTLAYRYFQSDRHFSGKEEHKNRKQEGSEVINTSRFVDLSIAYNINDRYNLGVTLPFAYHDRSQVVRANDPQRTILQRFHTQSTGIADAQVIATRWMIDPQSASKGNWTLGVGFDLPTGKKDAEDTFMVYDPKLKAIIAETRTVDQSIQLGDGGWGLILDANGFYGFTPALSGYVNATYTITPQEKNGVATFRSNPFESEMSIADTYLLRSGVDYLLSSKYNLSFTLGMRLEGVMVEDLTGGSDGFRRPGYDLSVEPGLVLGLDSWVVSLYVPVSVERNRQRSVPDEQYTESSGVYRHGDAAFADYSVTFALSKNF